MTDTEIANEALALLSENPIASLDDASEAAKLAKRHFWSNADEMVIEHRWRFAKARSPQLAPAEWADPWEWSYRFALPVEPYCLQVINLDGDFKEPFSVEGRFLYCNVPSPRLSYIARITDVSLWHPLFTSAFRFRLAAKMARTVTESGDIVKENYGLYADEVRKAKTSSAIETHAQTLGGRALLDVR